MKPYYADEAVQLYLGDMRGVLPALDIQADAAIVDPPYGETSLTWDRWPDGWPSLVARYTRSMWCFGSMRMFLDRWGEFADWKLSQDVVWEKHNGSGFATDRFRRVHEHVLHFYRGDWRGVHHDTPRVPNEGRNQGTRRARVQTTHTGKVNEQHQAWCDNGTRLIRSVVKAHSMKGSAIHPTEKPVGVVSPLLRYAVPPGGLVLDPCTGSASTLLAARTLGMRGIGIEADEKFCEAAARRLSIPDLFGGAA